MPRLLDLFIILLVEKNNTELQKIFLASNELIS